MKKIMKILSVIERKFIMSLIYVNVDLYMKAYFYHLKKVGINISKYPKFINKDVYFDGHDYSKITIGENVTISREVMFLTHDYSITTAHAAIGISIKRNQGEVLISEGISVGRDCFIGARASILPGATIGNNVIIGACSVVKGNIPDDSIVIGNPCKVVGRTSEWVERKVALKKYSVEN